MTTVLLGIQKGKSGSIRQNGENVTYSERHRYVVQSDVKNESILNVLATPGLPVMMVSTIAGTDGQCICTGLDPKQDENSPYAWFVDVEWSTQAEKQTSGGNADPSTWVPVYSGKVEKYPTVLYTDQQGTPYLNSAGDRFPDPLVVTRPIIVYDFFQYEAPGITDVAIGDRNDTINSGLVRGFPARSLKCMISGFERGWFFGYPVVKINYSIAYKKDLWVNKPLNVGYSYRLSAGGERIASDKLVYLNSNGTKKPDSGTPDAMTFYEFREISFSFLR